MVGDHHSMGRLAATVLGDMIEPTKCRGKHSHNEAVVHLCLAEDRL